MKNLFLILCCIPSLCFSAETWFEDNSPLNQAHQKLLDNDLTGSFASIIQVWQSDPDKYIESHLNELLLKTLENDCGKSIDSEPVATWIQNVVIKRQSVQSPGKSTSRAIVEVTSNTDISSIELLGWPGIAISNESSLETLSNKNGSTYTLTYELNQRMPSGLYRLQVTNGLDETWSLWVVMGESPAKQVVRWDSKDTWAVDKLYRLNPYCSLPILSVSLFDYVDNEYIRVWHQQYENDYPTRLSAGKLKADRYVLAVGITHQRWQGSIAIEDQQVISKTYDISTE